ncbi:MAG TPA: hypothetical protein VK658_12150 [Chryseolinea sp.]|nr:hypothetical protein [Chryseolinea sp.]
MKSFLGAIALTLIFSRVSNAQQPSLLFQDETPLEISFAAPLSELKHEDEDSVYFASVLLYKKPDGSLDSVRIGLRARGNYRRKHCALPPLRIKVNKEDRKKEGLFSGVKSLKLVLPCQNTRNSNDLILKEYLCYQLYKPTTPYVLNTRLVNITLTETTGKHEVLKLAGFLIEDDDDAARRLNAKVVNSEKVNPFMLQDTCAIRFDVFQFMIGNTDYSTVYFHNAKVLRTKSNVLLPIAYDFDMSGFVSAPYASVDPTLGIESVRERVYRGFCRGNAVAESVRREYVDLEPTILGVIDKHQALFSEKESTGMKRYLKEFFTIMRSDGIYKQRIGQACRTN